MHFTRVKTFLNFSHDCTHMFYDLVMIRDIFMRDNKWLMYTLHLSMKRTKYYSQSKHSDRFIFVECNYSSVQVQEAMLEFLAPPLCVPSATHTIVVPAHWDKEKKHEFPWSKPHAFLFFPLSFTFWLMRMQSMYFGYWSREENSCGTNHNMLILLHEVCPTTPRLCHKKHDEKKRLKTTEYGVSHC